MKVKLKHGVLKYKGTRYSSGEQLEVTDLFYSYHKERLEEVKAKKPTKKAVKKTSEASE